MNFRELMDKSGKPVDWRDAMTEIRADHGRGASRWLADQFDVSMRTAQRWLKGEQHPGGREGTRGGKSAEQRMIGAVDTNRSAARYLRTATRIEIPEMDMTTSAGTGKRKPGGYPVTGAVQSRLNGIADAMERGDAAGAEKMFSDLTLELYFGKGNVGGRHKQSDMGVAGYGDGTTIYGR